MLIHKMRLDGYMAVLDVNSGAVHLVDDVIYDLLDVFDGTNDDEAIAALQTSYPEKDLREALEELHQLQEEGFLFSHPEAPVAFSAGQCNPYDLPPDSYMVLGTGTVSSDRLPSSSAFCMPVHGNSP